jgi:hypothetical protein
MAADPLATGTDVWTEEDGSVTVTLKGASGYEAPWLVVKGRTAADVLKQFEGDTVAKLMKEVSEANASFGRVWLAARNAPVPQPGQYGKPAGASEKPGASDELPFANSSAKEDPSICQHGQRTFHEAGGKRGWVCPVPKGEPGRCDTLFV